MEQTEYAGQVVLLIPALNPDERLKALLDALRGLWTDPILLVDDGSAPPCRAIFDQAQADGCHVVRHARNLGKGRGLKTGFNYCLTHFPGALGVVTADADGQHPPQDILACADALRARPDALILGCRDFAASGVPARSQLGNRITRTFMRLLCGVGVTDTQTGLRAIPSAFMLQMLDLPGERFEFETNMLLETQSRDVPIVEVPIQTVYLEENKSSHFNPLLDSWRIYKLLLKFCAASIAGFGVDILLFTLFLLIFRGMKVYLVEPIIAATVLARILSATVNYLINHKAVFKSKKSSRRSFPRYAVLCVVQMALSAALVTWICSLGASSATLVKLVVDLLLFLLSFQIQRRWVF